MTTTIQPSTESSPTATEEGALPSIDAELLDGVVGGCAGCGTPGAPCATSTQGGSAALANLFAASFARR